MTLFDVEAMLKRQAHAWTVEDADLIVADFAPNARFQSPLGRWIGHDQIREMANAFFQIGTEVKVTITRIIFDGASGAVEWTWEETWRESGTHHRAEDAIIFEVRNGKIIYWREYYDPAQQAKPMDQGSGSGSK